MNPLPARLPGHTRVTEACRQLRAQGLRLVLTRAGLRVVRSH